MERLVFGGSPPLLKRIKQSNAECVYMGHTIPAKRHVIYSKLTELEKFAHTLRQPYRDRMLAHIQSAYQHISALVYTNSLDDEESLIYAMLASLVQNSSPRSTPKVRKCLAILLSDADSRPSSTVDASRLSFSKVLS